MNLLSSLLKFTADKLTSLGNRLTTAEGDIDSLEAQFTTVVSAVTTDTEVTNIRVGDDGVTYDTAGNAVRKQFSDVKSAIEYKADARFGGTEISEDVILTNKTAWSAVSGNRLVTLHDNRASSSIIKIKPNMKSLSCANGYLMSVMANNNGEGNAMTIIGASTWGSSVSLENVAYKYLAINIKKNDESDFPDGTTTSVVTITKYSQALPYALQTDVEDAIGAKYILPVKSGTIGATGIEDSRVSRIISKEYIYVANYHGKIEIPAGHSILIAYYNSSLEWVSNSTWMNECNVEDLLAYPYIRIVARNNSHLNDDISGELPFIEIVLNRHVDSSAVLTDKSNGIGLFINPVEKGGLIQVGRLGWRVYANDTPPEQSIPSYLLAYENGCRVMLADLRVTSDGTFVCWHDDDLGAQLSTNTVRHIDGTELTPTEKAYEISSLSIAQLDGYDFGIYKGSQYAGMKMLRLTDFLKFCKVMNCTAMLETKVALTEEQVVDVIKLIKLYGLRKSIVWAENAFSEWAGVSLPLVNLALPDAVIHLRGGSSNLASCLRYAEQYASASNPVEIGFLDTASITEPVISELLSRNIDIAYSEVKSVATLESMIASGLIYKLKSVACSYINLGEYFANRYRDKRSNIIA